MWCRIDKFFWMQLLIALVIIVPLGCFAQDSSTAQQSPALSLSTQQQVQQLPATPVVLSPANSEKVESSMKSTEFVDVARLVLEHNRDLATSTTLHIDRTINMLVLGTTIFAGLCAFFGWSKLRSLEDAAKERLDVFNGELDEFRAKATQMRDGFSTNLDAAMDELRAEINCRIELLTARAEIANAESTTATPEKMQILGFAISRIERALQLPNLASPIKIKALADLGYAKKRSGDLNGALQKIIEAEAIATKDATHMVALLAYNAACYSALLNRADTRAWLEKAITADKEMLEAACKDEDLLSVRQEPWFQALVTRI